MKRFFSIFCCTAFTFFSVGVSSVSAFYNNMPASLVIGQADFTHNASNQGNGTNAEPNTVGFPYGMIMVGSRFVLADQTNNRVLIFPSFPTANNQSASVVIGQQNFQGSGQNQGQPNTPFANTLRVPDQLASDGTKLVVTDSNNNRVLVFNQLPTSNNASADVVIGQTDMTTRTTGITASTLNAPHAIFYDSATGKLFISDTNNNRVLIYNSIPTTNGASADTVLGQVDFTHNAINKGGSPDATTLRFVFGIWVQDGRLFVSDTGNSRILIWNTIPTVNDAPADVVVGQSSFSGVTANQGGSVGPNTVNTPRGIFVLGTRLFINDTNNNRLLIYNTIPTQNNASADVVLGQPNFATNTANQGNLGANTLQVPIFAFSVNTKLLVSDGFNNRILIYDDDLTAPSLSVSNSPQAIDSGLVKLAGNASTINHYTIQNVQYMVNGGGFNGATATDGSFDSGNENFFFTFDPRSNNNKEDGYTVQIKSTTSNVDTTDHLFYFQPFNLNTPGDRSFISKSLPTFSFSVNKQQTQLKENLSKYTVMVKKSGGDWINYVDNIPVDYASVKDSVDNVQKSNLSTDGNGVYEDKKILVVYSNNNSSISVTPKAVDDQGNTNSLSFDQNGKLLNNGGYEWKVQAVDKNQHVQETETRKFVVGASAFSNGSNWFPLQINSITGLGRVYLSTINPQLIKLKYRIQTSNPIFKGIATANSTVQLDLTNQTCLAKGESSCVQTFSASANGASQFSLSTSANTLKTGSVYQAQFSVSQNGLFNALPPFQVSR